MMRFYSLTDVDCLSMPFPRLLLLYDKINALATEEEIKAIIVAHCGDPQGRVRALHEQLYLVAPTAVPAQPPSETIKSEAGFVGNLDMAEWEAKRERQRAANERIRAEWLEQQPGKT